MGFYLQLTSYEAARKLPWKSPVLRSSESFSHQFCACSSSAPLQDPIDTDAELAGVLWNKFNIRYKAKSWAEWPGCSFSLRIFALVAVLPSHHRTGQDLEEEPSRLLPH